MRIGASISAISTYTLSLIAGFIWLVSLSQAFQAARHEWNELGNFLPAAGFVLLPMLMLAYSTVLPFLCRRAGNFRQGFYAALTGFLAFIPWFLFIGAKWTVGVAYL